MDIQRLSQFKPHLFRLIAFSLLALGLNYIRVPLFFGVDFLFGSVITLLVLRLYGLSYGVVIACVTGIYTLILWGHPYAMVILIAEALVVGVLLKFMKDNLIVADALFWLFVGAPFVFLFYHNTMGMELIPTTLIALKQPINGVVNAIIATLCIIIISVRTEGVSSARLVPYKVSIAEFVFFIILSSSFFSVLSVVVVSSHNSTQERLRNLKSEFDNEYLVLTHFLDEKEGVSKELLPFYQFKAKVEHRYLILFDKDMDILSSTLPENDDAKALLSASEMAVDGLRLWLPERGNKPLMRWWMSGYYFIERDLSHSNLNKVVLAYPTRNIIHHIQQYQNGMLFMLVVFFIFGLVVSKFISRIFSRSVMTLAEKTINVPDKLARGEEIQWPVSGIVEFDLLSKNVEEMSTQIQQNLAEMRQIHSRLEKTVEDTSADLVAMAARNRAVINNTIVGIITIDESGKIETANGAIETILGYVADEIVGKNVRVLMPEPYRSNHDGFLSHYRKTGQRRIIGSVREVEAINKEGRIIPIELSVSEAVYSGNRFFIGVISDISRRKAAENIKNEFVSNVSHELRTPLTAIRGAIGLLESGTLGDLNERTKAMLNMTVSNTDRLIRLVNDLLDIQKMEAGEDNFILHNQAIMPVIKQVIEENSSYANQFGIELVSQGDLGDLTTRINADRLNQVITNLISNAVKFSPEKGKVTVTLSSSRDSVIISISDQGKGIPQDFMPQLFEKFTQSSGDEQIKVKGTGLGLSISKSIIERMGGMIRVQSVVGEGATFTVTLPISH